MTNKDFIKRYLLLKIFVGDFKIKSLLPSENALAKQFNCTRQTARKVYDYLEALNIISAHKGKGYIVELNPLNHYWSLYCLIENKKFTIKKKQKSHNFYYYQFEFKENKPFYCQIDFKSQFKLDLNFQNEYSFHELMNEYVFLTNFSWDYIKEKVHTEPKDDLGLVIKSTSNLIDNQNEMNNMDVTIELDARFLCQSRVNKIK